jgi:hypothetical protein
MNFMVTQEDRAALPTAMLAAMKAHLRISWVYDDATITEKLGMAIDKLQTDFGFRIVPSTYEWTPDAADFVNGKARIPYPPVRSMVIAGADQAGYALELRSIDGVPIVYLVGSHVDGLIVTIETGFQAAVNLAPGLADVIQRTAAHLFEHREILVPGRDFMVPDFASSAAWWLPRV